MNIENVQHRKEFLLSQIEREQTELKSAFQDLKTSVKSSVSVSERIRSYPKAWVFGALAVGFLAGEFS